jgi:putative transposase
LTHVTYNRAPLLINNIELFWESYEFTCASINMKLIAWVILPDHVHLLIEPKSNNISNIMKHFKLKYSGLYRSRYNLQSGRIWQYRYWDHIIRNQNDLNRHFDYIHYNQVKHEIVHNPHIYEYSSINKYRDFYSEDWGVREKVDCDGNFGE